MRQFLEAEIPLFFPRRGGAFRVALAYPNRYSIAMSNLGFQSVLRMLGDVRDVACERAFLPEDADLRGGMGGARGLASFESGTELRQFHLVAFSVSFEEDWINALRMLQMAGIPLRALDRGPRDPIVAFGGAAVFLNPEPAAPFADFMAVGEGEALVPAMMRALLGADDPRQGIRMLAHEQGFYVPSRYAVRYSADGTIAGYDGPGRVVRQRAAPGEMPLPESAILTPNSEMSMKYLVEISRGCPCMCRFCWAGHNYLPVRCVARARILARAAEARRVTNKVGLVATAVCDHPEVLGIVDDLAQLGFEVSVASLRIDDVTPPLLSRLVAAGVQGLALAPECGSDRLRRVLNKAFTNAEIVERATDAFKSGVRNLKLYYMVGLPGEESSDVEAIVTLTEQIRARLLDVGRPRGRVGRIQPSVNPFVPKPGTPFQWLPVEDPRVTERKLQLLRKAFGRMANVDAVVKSVRSVFQQSVLALADRRVADALEHAVVRGVGFGRAVRDVGLDPGFYLYRRRGSDEVMPWDVVDNGVRREHLLQELLASRQDRATPHCPSAPGCYRCGVCGTAQGRP